MIDRLSLKDLIPHDAMLGARPEGRYTEEELDLTSYRPTLVIGLGGTGYKVVRKLKRRIRLHFQENQLGVFQFLVIDTDAETPPAGEEKLDPGEFVYLASFPANRIIQELDTNPHIEAWWPKGHMPTFLGTGAGRVRAVGRLALFHYLETEILPAFKNKLNRSLQVAAQLGLGPQTVKVYIIASLAGGTGSGQFLDMAYIARHEVMQQIAGSCYVTGVLVTPDVFVPLGKSPTERDEFQANGFAALQELDYFTDLREFNVRYSSGYSTRRLPPGHRPFDLCYLVGLTNERNLTLEGLDSVTEMVAEEVMMEIASPMSAEATNRLDNVRGNLTRIAGRYPAAYSSFAISSLVYPVWGIASWCALKSTAFFVRDAILKPISSSEDAGMEVGQFIDEHGLREAEADQLTNALRQDEEGKRLELELLLHEDYIALPDELVLSTMQDTKRSAREKLELVKEEVEDRRREREDDDLEALTARLHQVVTDPDRGPQYAYWYLTKLQAKIRAYRDEEMLVEQREHQGEMEAQRGFAEAAEDDVRRALNLSRVVPWRGRVLERRLRAFVDAYNRYMEESLEGQLRESSVKLYNALLKKIDHLLAQLQSLLAAFQAEAERCESTVEQAATWVVRPHYSLVTSVVDEDQLESIYDEYRPDLQQVETRRRFLEHFWDHFQSRVPEWSLEQPSRVRDASPTAQIYYFLGSYFAQQAGQKSLLDKMRHIYGDDWDDRIDLQFQRTAPFWTHAPGKYAGEVRRNLQYTPDLVGYGADDAQADWSEEIGDILNVRVDAVETKNPHEMVFLRTAHGLPLFALLPYRVALREAYDLLQQQWERGDRSVPLHASREWEDEVAEERSQSEKVS